MNLFGMFRPKTQDVDFLELVALVTGQDPRGEDPPPVLKVFEFVCRERTTQRRHVTGALDLAREDVDDALEMIRGMGLVGYREGPILLTDRFYLTAKGMKAESLLQSKL